MLCSRRGPSRSAPDREDGRADEDGAGVVRLARDRLVEIGERAGEFVIALQERGAHDQHGGGRFGILPPWRQRGLRIAKIARVAFAPGNPVVGIGKRHGRIDIARLAAAFAFSSLSSRYSTLLRSGRRSSTWASSVGTKGSARAGEESCECQQE